MPNTATDDHRYLILAPWGDQAYGDTIEQARAAKRTLAQDRRDNGHYDQRQVVILDRGFTQS